MNAVFSCACFILCAALASSPAGAALTMGNSQGGSSLVLSVWDNSRNVSYTRNLGPTLNGFLPSGLTTLDTDGSPYGVPVTGDKTPVNGLSISFAPDSTLFTTAFADSNPANLRWNVVAYDNLSFPVAGVSRVITTATAMPQSTNNGIDNIGVGGFNYLGALLSASAIATQQSVTVTTGPFQPGYAGNATWGASLNNGGLDSAAAGLSSAIGFYYLARTAVTGANDTPATALRYGNGDQFASWSLSAGGTATYSLTAAVPLPASVWMFGAGLTGFVGLVRHRRVAGEQSKPEPREAKPAH